MEPFDEAGEYLIGVGGLGSYNMVKTLNSWVNISFYR